MIRDDMIQVLERTRCRAENSLERTTNPVSSRNPVRILTRSKEEFKKAQQKKLGAQQIKTFMFFSFLQKVFLEFFFFLHRMDASSSQSSSRPCQWPPGGLWMRSWDVRRYFLSYHFYKKRITTKQSAWNKCKYLSFWKQGL